jgi:tetratricopeptide (TPR) repeat protein
MRQKKYQDAKKALLRAVALDPSKPDAHFQLGRLYQVLGNKAEASKELAKVRELNQNADPTLQEKMSSTPSLPNPSND